MRDAYLLFDTPLGWCGVAWSRVGLLAAQLPDPNPAATRAQLLRSAPGALEARPSPIAPILGALPLDLRGVPPLHARVYAIVRRIPCGRTLTYGQVAEALGDRQLARAVGQAMARNRFAPVVPCHRVLGAHGRPGGFSARGGLRTKLQLLQIEGARLSPEPDLFGDAPNKR